MIRVDGRGVTWTMDAWTARQLAGILDREAQPLRPGGRGDAGWREDSDALAAAADELEAHEAERGAASDRLDAIIGGFVVRMVHPDWPDPHA